MDSNKTANLEYVDNLQKKILSLKADCKRKDELLNEALDRVEDMYRSDDGQAWKEAKKILAKYGRFKYL